MKQDRIEERFKEAVERAVPDVKDSLMKSITERKSKIMTMEKKRTVPKRWISVLVAAALVLVLGGAGLGVNYQINYRVDSVVGLDVNPSIVLELNQREKVVQARALNEDAEVVLEGMDLSGADLNVAINALIGSLLRNGYINELANSILVTVEGQDLDKETQLQERLTQEINDILQASSIEASVLGQTLPGRRCPHHHGQHLQHFSGQGRPDPEDHRGRPHEDRGQPGPLGALTSSTCS